MTRAKRWIIVTSTVGLFWAGGITAQARAADLFVDVGGTVRNNDTHPDGANTDRVVLAPSSGVPVIYGNGTIEISALQTGTPAMVERVLDDDSDLIAFHNVRIKRLAGPVSNFPISFWGTAVVQPATPPSYYYNLEANGSWGGPAINDSFTFKTYIRLLGGNWTEYKSWTKSINCSVPCVRTFSSGAKQSANAYSPGANPRDLKGALTITLLTNNDTLNFNKGTGGRAKSGAQLDCDFTDTFANWFRDDPGNCVYDE